MPVSSAQRAFNAPPRKARPGSSMPATTARSPSACPLCELRIKVGQRVGKDYASGEWAHLGCVVRLVHALNDVQA